MSLSGVSSSDEGRTWIATGTVNASTDSDEELTYSISAFQDEAGNDGDTSSYSTVRLSGTESEQIIIDTNAPTITSVTANLSKVDSTLTDQEENRAAPGDTITLTIQANEALDDLDTSDVSINRVSLSGVSSSDEGRTWIATGTVNASTDSDEELTYSISAFQDEAGNDGDTSSYSTVRLSGTESEQIIIDTNAPTITSVTANLSKVDSMLTEENRAAPGDTITLTIEANEALDDLDLSLIHI